MTLAVGILVLVAVVSVAVGAILLVRRRAPEGSYFSDGDRASGVFGVLATGFSIFAGFVVFLAFTSYDQSRSGAETEALVVVQQYETAQLLPESTRARLGGELSCYGRYVVHQEWPRMEDGSAGDAISPWGLALFRSIQTVRPTTSTEESAYDKWLEQTSTREEARRDRLHGAAGIIPTSIWVVLFLVGAIVFAFMLFFADPAEMARSQAMLIGSATAVVVVTLLAITALDKPFSGIGGIESVAMERSLDLLDQARSALGDTSEPPCNDDGEPQ